MPIYIYNSLSRKKEVFKPIHEGVVTMYVCGPTVYGPPHVGHARSYVNFDIVRRYLEHAGYFVKYVQNITDVGHLVGDSDSGEDKIIAQSLKENLDPYALAYKYEVLYFKYMDMLNIKRPVISARATGVIPEIIEMIQTIIDKGYGYVTKQGNVYFSVHKFNEYGKLSNRRLENNLSGERISVADDKENAEDFALWKTASDGHIMKWNSPWGVGYPGWHIECSTISKKYLGKTFDIHGGGIDNIFPHHDSEIAQSEVANGCKFVNYFIHNNLVTINGTKMGKSLGNFITLEDLFKQYQPMVVRYFIIQFHYRKPVDFSIDGLNASKEQFEKISEALSKIKTRAAGQTVAPSNDELLSVVKNFEDAMNDDFNTPLATAELIRFSKLAPKLIDSDDSLLGQVNFVINMFENVLGLEFNCGNIDEQAEAGNDQKLLDLIGSVRDKLRQQKNYELSDYIRDELTKLDINVSDKKIK